jgi:hypothetical protein
VKPKSHISCHNPISAKCGGWSPTLGKSEDLESSGTPECSELDNKAQNTLHWGVIGVIGKVLKHRYRKWPRIGHSDICSPSYGQKKGRESNWQFDFRPLKSRESTSSWRRLEECDTALESSWQELQLWFRICPDLSLGWGVMAVQSSRSPARIISGLHFGSPNKMCHLDVASATSRTEYYRE